MAVVMRISKFLDKKAWIIPVLFGTMCALFVAIIVLLEVRLFHNCHPRNAFSIGAELCAMVVAIMMSLSILPSYKRQSTYNRIFVSLLTIGCFALFFDSLQMLFDGDPDFIVLNKVVSVLIFANSSLYLFFFWLYANLVLKSKSKTIKVLNIIASILVPINFIVPFINLFYPVFFEINASGSFARVMPWWYFSQDFVLYLIVALTIAIIKSKERVKTKLVISAFTALPIIAILVAGYANVPDGEPTVTVQYSAMMASLVLIYAFLFSDNERTLYSQNKELGIATNIQKNMLPNIFPAFPDRKEFDVYASMTPAKEVGGDFYDFFLIDETHLGLVMADVSDKGVPAALFMMASKIMVQNFAMLESSPKKILSAVNKQICSNNQYGMFVTIWLGILDLKTGTLVASNAGHERPVIKKPNGDFEIIKDVHGFVVGWEADFPYNEYTIQLEKGAKLFLYTDGVPEAANQNGRYGCDRMLETLIKNENLTPKEIVINLKKDLDEFVGTHYQFDDVTMLCVEYRGGGSNE